VSEADNRITVEKRVLNIEDLVAEFDEQYRIVHQTGREVLQIQTLQQAEILAEATDCNLARFLGDEKGYLVTNISKIVIEPSVYELYAAKINELITKYLHPHGIARYGYAIGRVTVRMSHESNLIRDLNLFATKEEAFAFIKGLELKRSELENVFAKRK
jgi:hypothetical protein